MSASEAHVEPAGARVVVEGLRREYPGGIVALDGVDLTIEPGEFVVLTGPSGSGKTTMLSLIGALDVPTAGSVSVDGLRLDDPALDRPRFHRDVVGLIFQHHYLLSRLDAHSNVELSLLGAGVPRRERGVRSQELLDEVGLAHRSESMTAHLSGGERQRVAVARALANSPRLLLADEPTGALDSANADQVLELLEDVRRRRGTTLLVVTHDAYVAERADRVVHLRDGRRVDAPPSLRAHREELGA